MKHVSFAVRFCICIATCFVFACNCKKIPQDYSNIMLEQYYAGKLSSGEQVYVVFHEADSIITGTYFVYTGKAVVQQYQFSGEQLKKKIQVEIDGVKPLKYKGMFLSGKDTVCCVFPISGGSLFKKEQDTLILIREKPIKPHYFKKRYIQPAFPKVRVEEITYGKADGYYTSKPVENLKENQYPAIILDVGKRLMQNILMTELPLKMDLYQPVGDTLKRRPLIVLIHGGAFIIGDKKTPTMEELGNYFAQRGFLVAAINYRLGYLFAPGGYAYLERCIYRAVQDARAALRYLVHYADNYRIDTNYIFVAGNSAGGFTALKTAFMDETEIFESAEGNTLLLRDDLGCLDCSGNKFTEKFNIRGVVNMWGALTDIDIIDADENIPVLLFHGDKDGIVPPEYEFPFANVGTEFSAFFSHRTWGSVSIHKHLKKLGIQSTLILFEGAGHDPQVDENNRFNDNMKRIETEMSAFLIGLISSADSVRIAGKSNILPDENAKLYEVRGNDSYLVNWKIEGGKIIERQAGGKRIKVVWFASATEHKLEVEVRNTIGWLMFAEKTISVNN